MLTRFAIPFFLCLLLIAAALTSGCISDADPEEPSLPWNEPAGWENNGFYVPM